MNAISLFRRRRIARFAAFSAYFGGMLVPVGYAVLGGIGWLVGVVKDFSLDDFGRILIVALVASASFATGGGIIGAVTARLTPRIWAWRMLGVFVIGLSGGMLALTYAWATPTLVGWAIVSMVTLGGVATGALVISLAKDKATENL